VDALRDLPYLGLSCCRQYIVLPVKQWDCIPAQLVHRVGGRSRRRLAILSLEHIDCEIRGRCTNAVELGDWSLVPQRVKVLVNLGIGCLPARRGVYEWRCLDFNEKDRLMFEFNDEGDRVVDISQGIPLLRGRDGDSGLVHSVLGDNEEILARWKEFVKDDGPTSIPLKFSGCVLIEVLEFAPYMCWPDHDGGCGSGWRVCGGGTAWNLCSVPEGV
jgi:hypothetical protein